MICLGNICINTLHKGDNDEDDDNNNNNNNNYLGETGSTHREVRREGETFVGK
jgi:hypothetical protein